MAIFSRNNDRADNSSSADMEGRKPLRILAERYARGEIRREEFLQIRRDLIEQEASAKQRADPRGATAGDSTWVDSVSSDASLLPVVSAFIVATQGSEPSRILAGLIRALYLDGSAFHFDFLERLDAERRAWAEALIKAKLEHVIPLDVWGRAYEIVRDFEYAGQHGSAKGTNGGEAAAAATSGPDTAHKESDWDTLLEQAERFLDSAKGAGAESAGRNGAAETTGARVSTAEAPDAETQDIGDGPILVQADVPPTVEAPEAAYPVAHAEETTLAIPFVPLPPKRNLGPRYGVAAAILIGIAVTAFMFFKRGVPVSAPAKALESVAAAPAESAPAQSGVDAAVTPQQSVGQVVAAAPSPPPLSAGESGTSAARGETADHPKPEAVKPPPEAATPVPPELPAQTTKDNTAKQGASTAGNTVATKKPTPPPKVVLPIALTPTQRPAPPAPPPQKLAKADTSSVATPGEKPQMPAKPAEPATAATADARPAPPTQTAALVPVPARPPAEQRPAPRADDIEAWSGGEEALQQGMRNYQAGNYKDAADNLQRALEAGLRLKRNTVTAHKYLALSQCALGHENQCRQEFQQALRIDPSMPLAPEEEAAPRVNAAYGSAKEASKGR